jgi:Fe-S-cluster containining protein
MTAKIETGPPAMFRSIDSGPKPIGSVTTYMRKLEQGRRDGNVRVPCGSCNACCRTPYLLIELQDGELGDFPEAVRLEEETGSGNRWMLPKAEDGSCAHLIDGKCSIYQRRPKCCRSYDCRVHILVGCGPNDPILVEALSQWQDLELKTTEDWVTKTAIMMAMADGGMPKSLEEIAVKSGNVKRYIPAAKKVAHLVMNLSTEEREQLAKEFEVMEGSER